MALLHEELFYEVMWRTWSQGLPYPVPWWVQQYLRRWIDTFDGGLFDSKQAAFASNAAYRYWNMVGVKDAKEETLVGQAGDVEPVYDQYALAFFVFQPSTSTLHLPHLLDPADPPSVLTQRLDDGYLPVVVTAYRPLPGLTVTERVFATTVGPRARSIAVARLRVTADNGGPHDGWLCAAVVPAGPSGFQRHDRAGRYLANGAVGSIRYRPNERRVEVNGDLGPLFDTAPAHFGVYGNPQSTHDPDHYVRTSPFAELTRLGTLNGLDSALDAVGGMCSAVFAWPFHVDAAGGPFEVDIRFPIDDFRGGADMVELRSVPAAALDGTNQQWWETKLATGLQLDLPPTVAHLWDLFRLSRATLLMLADDGAIHPGPTIYDEFWVRDSSVEGIACALAGEMGLPSRQYGTHYRAVFNTGNEFIGPVRMHGFFGGAHERNDQEWDSNGEALWAFGRFDRVSGAAAGFGAGLYAPYIIEGARWLRDNRSQFGLLHSGWSAEHLGDKDKPHYWDDLWAVAGLYEAARLAERLRAAETQELWDIYDDVAGATTDSIRWVLGEQRRQGHWKTFVPTGPGNVGELDSTIVGAAAYFHPCRLHIGAKLGAEVDAAFRLTLDTIWSDFVTGGGFRHDRAWHAYGPYITLQLAHAFLFTGQLDRMDACLKWSVGNAAYSTISRQAGDTVHRWPVVQGAWNEQHAYPIASDFAEVHDEWWYMGDIPHGWAAAELLFLLRDIALFESDEDGDRHLFIAPGLMPHWLGDGQEFAVRDAPTVFGAPFGYRVRHDAGARTIDLRITQPAPAGVRYVFPCRFGARVVDVVAAGAGVGADGRSVLLPAGTTTAKVRYA